MVSRDSHQQDLLVIEDGRAAYAGIGVVVPALLVGTLFYLLWPSGSAIPPLGGTMLAFAATAVALAVLRVPRTAVVDRTQKEIRLTAGWPPFERQRIIPFSDISAIKVWQPIKLGDDRLGYARPALVLTDGSRVFLSTYNRSPRRCREIADRVGSGVFAQEG